MSIHTIYDDQKNIKAELENIHRGLGEVIHLKYTSPDTHFSMIY
jgi:hypothetical protein